MSNPLDNYRRVQRELRREFAAFTRANCPTCPTPCCRKPARIALSDIALAQSSGWKAPHSLPEGETNREEGAAEPCDYLGKQGCTFPSDLRPFGCTAYLCRFMYARLDRRTLTRIKRLAQEMEEHHTALLQTLPEALRHDEAEG